MIYLELEPSLRFPGSFFKADRVILTPSEFHAAGVMKVSVLRLAMLTGIGAVALMFPLQPYFTEGSELSAPTVNGGVLAFKVPGRKLKEEVYGRTINKGADGAGDMGTEDYGPIDPVPNSKTSVRAGPIDHGTPLIPYLPDPTGPSPPEPGG